MLWVPPPPCSGRPQVDAVQLGDDGPDALMLMRLLRARAVVSGPGPGLSAAAAAAAVMMILDDSDGDDLDDE
jgi:hypothetical protein